MKRFILSMSACAALTTGVSAADLPLRAPPPVFTPVPVFSWTGFYVGVNAGYAFDYNTRFRDFNDPTPGASATGVPFARPAFFSVKTEGVTAGGQAGYNYQFTPGAGVVVGIEADAAYTDLSRTSGVVLTNPATGFSTLSTLHSDLGFLGTVRGRLGYAFGRVLVYGTGGLAYGDLRTTSAFFSGTTTATPVNFFGDRRHIETGYTVGGGVEAALPTDSFLNFFKSSAVTVKLEALYYDLGTRPGSVVANTTLVPSPVGAYGQRVHTDGLLVRAGLNYKFGTF